jgi:hypothetical protein
LVSPVASESCNRIDDDCDGVVDEPDALDASVWFLDADGDGFVDGTRSVISCVQPADHRPEDAALDCDDANGLIFPGAAEVCNGLDDDCDGTMDEPEAVDALTWRLDADLDGYGVATVTVRACVQPAGTVADSGPEDCNDELASIYPMADEQCNGLDDDCDGIVDESDAVDAGVWYVDDDGDGYGDSATSSKSCDAPSQHVAIPGDCDDDAQEIHPAADEICDDVDNDCDGRVDALDDSYTGEAETAWFPDADLDGFGDAGALPVMSCGMPEGELVDDDSDCDDTDPDINPLATEVCDGFDEDCDGQVDDDACPYEVRTRDGHGYMFWQDRETWAVAQIYCQRYGYDLVTISDEDENAWVWEQASSINTRKWWIGYNDRVREGTFVWASGEDADYTNWSPGQPDDGRSTEECVHMGSGYADRWNDEQCYEDEWFVCESRGF